MTWFGTRTTETPKKTKMKALATGLLVAGIIITDIVVGGDPAHAAETFAVNATGNKGDLTPGDGKCFTGDILAVQGEECTLRAAMEEANDTPGADTIDFDIPGTGVRTISPTPELPAITSPVTINGYSQPGAKPNTKAVGSDAVLKIELGGAGSGSGLRLEAANSTVKGLVIYRWDYGISIVGSAATNNKVTGNYLGTDVSGTQDLGNSEEGVYVYDAPKNTVGGTTAAERNVISGNDDGGVAIQGAAAKGNKVAGNYVGADSSGTKDLGNANGGVNLIAPNNTVGGATAGARNVISGNGTEGVLIAGNGSTNNKVTGNYVGTDKNGIADLGNGNSGVVISGAPNNAIGGTTAGERNIISGNDESGVFIGGANARGNKVLGNYVGADASGTEDLKNSLQGVYVYDAPNNTIGGATTGARNVISGNNQSGVVIFLPGATGNKVAGNYIGADAAGTKDLGNYLQGVFVYNAPNNTIGGATVAERNVISGNGGDGVGIFGDGSTGNRVLSNSIFSNGGLGLELLGDDGVTANDPGDTDAGPNKLQNFPVLTNTKSSGKKKTAIEGTLNSAANTTFTIQFFSSPAADASGNGEGQKFLGSKSVTTDAGGNATFAATTPRVRKGQVVSATATNESTGDTSEFSKAVAAS